MSYMAISVSTTFNSRVLRNELYTAVLDALAETFQEDILSDAKGNCPVGSDPIEPGSMRNRDSLAVTAFGTRRGPFAKLYSQSGHGGYVEMGTRFMSAQPYVWPAFQRNVPRLMRSIKDHLAVVNAVTSRVRVDY